MNNYLGRFFISQKYFSALSIFFAAYLSIFFLNQICSNSFIKFLQIIGGIFFFIFGTGVSVTLIIQWLLKKKFNLEEFISLSLIGSLFVFPIILTVEFILFKKIYDWCPIVNGIIFWIGTVILLHFKKTSLPDFIFSARKIIKHPLFIVFTFGVVFTLIQVILYSTLPDLDPYKWLFKYTYQFANHQLDYIERPFFGSLIFIGTRFTGLSILTFFKYALPFFYLFVLFPAWMVARTFQDTKKQLIFLLTVFASPVIILYAQTAMPQTALIIFSYFFLFFLLYSYLKQDDFFLYVAGIIAFLSFFFHQSGVIIFLAWIIIIVINKRESLLNDKKTLLFLVILLATNWQRFRPLYDFTKNWVDTIIYYFSLPNKLNLLYPAFYGNIDHNSMGWSSFGGVIKFYAFHMGPLVGTILLSFLAMFLFDSGFRSFFNKKIAFKASLEIIFFSFLIYFAIAEVLPRFPNIALLPDRAWIFAGIFSFLFLFSLLSYVKKIPSYAFIIFMFLFLAGLSGATYINYLKKYLITPAQMQSAKWIEKKMPENRIFISYGHKSLLPVYANSPLMRIPVETYCSKNIEDFENIIDFNVHYIRNISLDTYGSFLKNAEEKIEKSYNSYRSNYKNEAEKYKDAVDLINTFSEETALAKEALANKTEGIPIIYPLSHSPVLTTPIFIENIYKQEKIDSFDSIKNNNFYIYYAKQHSLNPYRGRPYEMLTWGMDPCPDKKFLFDLYPDKFKRIYSTNNNEVIIWKVLPAPLEITEKNN